MKKILDVDSQEFLDESVSNFTVKDLFTTKAMTAALASGTPLGAIYEAKRQDAIKAKAEAAQANATAADIAASAQAQIELAKAEADLAKANIQIPQYPNQVSKVDDGKKFPWLLVGGVVFGVLALTTTAYFIFRKK